MGGRAAPSAAASDGAAPGGPHQGDRGRARAAAFRTSRAAAPRASPDSARRGAEGRAAARKARQACRGTESRTLLPREPRSVAGAGGDGRLDEDVADALAGGGARGGGGEPP